MRGDASALPDLATEIALKSTILGQLSQAPFVDSTQFYQVRRNPSFNCMGLMWVLEACSRTLKSIRI